MPLRGEESPETLLPPSFFSNACFVLSVDFEREEGLQAVQVSLWVRIAVLSISLNQLL